MGFSLDQIVDAISKVGNHFLKKDGTNSATAHIPMGGFKITGLGNGENPADAVTKSQLDSVAQSGGVRGSIIGAVKNVSGSPKFYYKDSGVTTENAAAIDGLYITLESVVLDTVTYPANSILKYGSAVWFLDGTTGTLGTFDSSASYADVGGALSQSARYQLLFPAYAGHSLPNSDITGWSEGDRMDWNAAYDTTGDDNVGRWVHSQSEAVPDATNAIKGKVKTGAGIQNLTGEIAANIDTARGLSWSDSTTNKPFGLNILTSFFEFVGGALGIKAGAITTTELASDVTTLIASKATDANVVHKTGDETVGGTKTYTSPVSIADNSFAYFKSGRFSSAVPYTYFSTFNTPVGQTCGFQFEIFNGTAEETAFKIEPDKSAKFFSTVIVSSPTIGGHAVNLTYLQANYYTETEVDTLLAAKAATSHTHTASAITDFTAASQAVGDARYGIPYQSTQNLASDLTTSTVALTALSPLPVNAQCVRVNINGAALKYGSDFTVNAGTGVITLDRTAIGYNVLTTYDVNIAWNGVS